MKLNTYLLMLESIREGNCKSRMVYRNLEMMNRLADFCL
jgi:hypothetical protein